MLAPVGEKVLMRGALNNASCEARRSHRYESVTKHLALDRANLFRFGALAAPALAASWQAIEGATPNVQVHPVPQNISTTYALAPRICRNYTFQHLFFFFCLCQICASSQSFCGFLNHCMYFWQLFWLRNTVASVKDWTQEWIQRFDLVVLIIFDCMELPNSPTFGLATLSANLPQPFQALVGSCKCPMQSLTRTRLIIPTFYAISPEPETACNCELSCW